ncbi:hypothetical protein Shyd_41400 [Streptomyces hydrogenans]|uniref:Uncharacterized protein n=1 Tax=Streptomyces hydrogenans TaxID=1873719 RepID=A0ABQ3PCQ1_9ACTN|nr:hypothetical protein Shyd_41400 [Streptomyces hydrogenans]
MAAMGLRLAQRANGVSTLHGAVSREMFAGLWPGFDTGEVPITSITNGVHAPTWTAPEVGRLGADASDAELWELRRTLRTRLVTDVRDRLRASWRQRGAAAAELGWTDSVLDPDVLTIGFARRVPSYKRLTLMLRDKDRLRALLLHPERPVQLVVAGKAHPPTTAARSSSRSWSASPTTPGSGTGSSSCPTTAWRWPAASTPAATSGSTTRSAPWRPAAPAA